MANGREEQQSKLADDLLYTYTILEEQPGAVAGSWIYNSKNNDFKWSKGMYSLFGIDPSLKVTPEIYIEFALDDQKSTAKRIVNHIYEGNKFDEVVQIRGDSHIKTLRVKGQPLEVHNELVTAGIDFDITDSLEFGKDLTWPDKVKTSFLEKLSEEFQNPLTLTIESIKKVIRKVGQDLPDNVLRELNHAQRNSARIEKLVRTLHDFTHLEERKANAKYVLSDMCKLTNQVSSTFRQVIEDSGLSFSIECERSNELIYIDQQIFAIALSNLLSNAFKFTFEGGIKIKVSQSRKHVKISVIDTGVGIHPINQRKIFQRFAKVETTEARSLDGMGVGLPLVKELMEMHGGNIVVTSTPRKGSEFTLSFPKGIEHIPPDQIQSGPVAKGDSLRGTIREIESWPGRDVTPVPNVNDLRMIPTVVVAESDREMRSYIVRSLEAKYKVLGADNGQQVLNLINTGFTPDLVIADTTMPRMNGFELLSAMRSTLDITVPVILLTKKSTAEEEVKGLYYGAHDYVVKPFSSEELLARVETRIEISRVGKHPEQSLQKANIVLEERVHHYMKELEISNKQLNQQNAKLTAVNEELTGLTYAASHDLREPMRKMKLFIGRLVREEHGLSDNGQYYFQRILSFVQTMNDLVNDITVYANFNDVVGPVTNIDLNIMLWALTDFLDPLLKEKGATIKFDLHEGLTGNYDQVRQAVYNLISNSLKFSKKNVPLVIDIKGRVLAGNSIEHDRADKNKAYYCITIADNGIGIDPSHHKQIFELFRKLHKHTIYPGTGIGLTIARRIMENHSGFITVESIPDEGSKFSCFFPVENIS